MPQINLDEEFSSFIEDNLVKRLKTQGIKFTENAEDLFVLAMQSQMKEQKKTRGAIRLLAQKMIDTFADEILRGASTARLQQRPFTVDFNMSIHWLKRIAVMNQLDKYETRPHS